MKIDKNMDTILIYILLVNYTSQTSKWWSWVKM